MFIFYLQEAPIRIKKYNRNMKFIIVLREPVSRAYSAYNYAIKNSWEDSRNSFLDTIGLENDRVRDKKYNLMYFENGKYYKHITYWYKFFPEKNFLIIKGSDLRSNSNMILNQIFTFLGIKKNNVDTTKEFNKAGIVRFKFLQNWLLNKFVVKSFFGLILPKRIKVWVRANIFKKLYAFNQKNQESKMLVENEIDIVSNIFKQDLEALKKEFSIDFDEKN